MAELNWNDSSEDGSRTLSDKDGNYIGMSDQGISAGGEWDNHFHATKEEFVALVVRLGLGPAIVDALRESIEIVFAKKECFSCFGTGLNNGYPCRPCGGTGSQAV